MDSNICQIINCVNNKTKNLEKKINIYGTLPNTLGTNNIVATYENGVSGAGGPAGDTRGDFSVDLQMSRIDSIQVASGDFATVGGLSIGPATSPLLISFLEIPRIFTPTLSPGTA